MPQSPNDPEQAAELLLVQLWERYFPTMEPDPGMPFGIRLVYASHRIPKPNEPALRLARAAFLQFVAPLFHGSADAAVRAMRDLEAFSQIYENVRSDYWISEEKVRKDGEEVFRVVKSLDLKPAHMPEDAQHMRLLTEAFWPLLPTLGRLYRALRRPQLILNWWIKFAHSTFVLMLTTPGPALLPAVTRFVKARASGSKYRHRAFDTTDIVNAYAEKALERASTPKFLSRFEPQVAGSIREAAGNSFAYFIVTVRNELRGISMKLSTGLPPATAKRWHKRGFAIATQLDRENARIATLRDQRHEIDGYTSQSALARKLRRPRSTVQKAINAAVQSGKIQVGPRGYVRDNDIAKLDEFLGKPRRRH